MCVEEVRVERWQEYNTLCMEAQNRNVIKLQEGRREKREGGQDESG